MSALQLDIAINPAGAVKATQDVKKGLDDVAGSAQRTEKALDEVGKSTRAIENGRPVIRRTATDMDNLGRSAATAGGAANDNFRRMAESAGIANRAVGLLKAAMVSLGAVIGISAISGMAERYTSLSNVLRVVAGEQGNVNKIIDDLNAIAGRTRTPLEAVATLYQRVSVAGSELGASQAEILRFTENVGLALAQQGGSAAQASGALLQLSQSLGAGVVRAEEFNSMLEGAYPIVLAAAKGIDAAGGSVGRLRQLVLEGKVSSQEFFRAILSQTDDLQKAFAGTTSSLGQAWAVLSDNITLAIGRMNESAGVTVAIASVMLALGNNLDVVAKAAGVAGVALGTAFAPAILAAMASGLTAIGTAGVAAFTAINVAIGLNPLGAVAIALTTTLTAAYLFRDEIKELFGVDVVQAFGAIGNAIVGMFSDAGQRTAAILSGIAALGPATKDTFIAAWDNFPAALEGVGIAAINAFLQVIEDGVNRAVDTLNTVLGAVGAPTIPPADFSDWKVEASEAATAVTDTFRKSYEAAANANWQTIMGAWGAYTEAATNALNAVGIGGAAVEELNEELNGTPAAAAAASSGIVGVTKTAEELARASREAEATQKALFAEADSAVAKFFPFETAVADAERLMGIVNDMENGLSDCQRPAARLDAEMVFNGLKEAA